MLTSPVAKRCARHSPALVSWLDCCARGLAQLVSRSGERRRLVRFAITGGFAGLVQLALLHAWTELGWPPLLANLLAFLVAAQVNFTISSLFTWGDRRAGQGSIRALARRWARFHVSIVGTTLLNLAAFTLARTTLPSVAAAALGIGAAALANFAAGDRFVFRADAGQGTGAAYRSSMPAVEAARDTPLIPGRQRPHGVGARQLHGGGDRRLWRPGPRHGRGRWPWPTTV